MPAKRGSRPLAFDPIQAARAHWESNGWQTAAATMAAVTSLVRSQQLFVQRIDEVLRPHGLTFARFELLRLLGFSTRGSLPLSIIGERLQVHPTSVTSLVDRLEADGLVKRKGHPTDRRVKLAELSVKGRAVVAAATETLNTAVFTPIPGLGPTETEQLISLLARFRHASGDFTNGHTP
jgi:DNA-binding MarR family transcriptional regulator